MNKKNLELKNVENEEICCLKITPLQVLRFSFTPANFLIYNSSNADVMSYLI